MGIDAQNNFVLIIHVRPFRWVHRSSPPQSQDTTLTVQNKAPIRSRTTGPAMLGERRNPTDRSTPRHFHQSQHESGWIDVQGHFELSIPTVGFPAHGGLETELLQQPPIGMGTILAPRTPVCLSRGDLGFSNLWSSLADQSKPLPRDIAFQAPDCLEFGMAFGDPPSHVSLGAWIRSKPPDGCDALRVVAGREQQLRATSSGAHSLTIAPIMASRSAGLCVSTPPLTTRPDEF